MKHPVFERLVRVRATRRFAMVAGLLATSCSTGSAPGGFDAAVGGADAAGQTDGGLAADGAPATDAATFCDPGACDTPPPASCAADGVSRITYGAGTCAGGTCEYPMNVEACAHGCAEGACLEAPICPDIGCDGELLWKRRIGNASSAWTDEEVTALAVRPDGGVVVVGTVGDRFPESDDPEAHVDLGAAGQVQGRTAGFVARLDPAGEPLWVRAIRQGDSGHATAPQVGLDATGNIFIVGWFEDSLTVADVAVDTDVDAGIYVAKLDGDGALMFAAVHAVEYPFRRVPELAVAPDGTFAILGTSHSTYQASVTFGGPPLTFAGQKSYVAVFESDGTHRWSALQGGQDTTLYVGSGVALDFDEAGRLALAISERPTGEASSVRLRLVDSLDGGEIWQRTVTGFGADGVALLSVDASDEVYLATGDIWSAETTAVEIGATSVAGVAFLIRWNGDGQLAWARGFQVGRGGFVDVVRDSGNSLIAGGYFVKRGDIGDGAFDIGAGSDAFALKLDAATGERRWAWLPTDASNPYVRTMDVSPAGTICLGGDFGFPSNASLDFDLGDGDPLISAARDGFVACLAP